MLLVQRHNVGRLVYCKLQSLCLQNRFDCNELVCRKVMHCNFVRRRLGIAFTFARPQSALGYRSPEVTRVNSAMSTQHLRSPPLMSGKEHPRCTTQKERFALGCGCVSGMPQAIGKERSWFFTQRRLKPPAAGPVSVLPRDEGVMRWGPSVCASHLSPSICLSSSVLRRRRATITRL